MCSGETWVAKAGSFDPTSGIWVEPVLWAHRQSSGKCVCVQACTSLASSASYCPVKPRYEVTYWHANFTSNKSCDCIHSLNYVVLLKRSLVPRPCPAFCHLLDGARNWHSRFASATHALLASYPGHS